MARITADKVKPDFGVPWPRFEDKDYEKLPPGELETDFALKKRIEDAAFDDPIRFGWTLEGWREVCENWLKYDYHLVLGGNRSSKTKFGSRLVIDLLERIPECRIRAYQVNEDKSIAEMQAYVWEALPEKYKGFEKKRGQAYSIQYTQQNGFVGSKLILPPQPGYKRGSEIIFCNYQQYRNDPQTSEGWWAHMIWADEECPQKLWERLMTRLYDVHGRMLLTFTTIQGWSPLIADILGRTKTLRKRHSDLLGRKIQVAQESISRPGCRIYYFWTQDNPFIPDDTIDKMRGRPEAEILAIAHGIPTRNATTKFPKFNENVHVIKEEELPWTKAVLAGKELPEITRYHIMDPGGSKPWFMLWAGVDSSENVYIYREWPDMGYGNWGEPSEKPEGQRGPAQKPNGFGIQDYVDMILNCEAEEQIFERLIDPRMGASTTQGDEGAESIQSKLEDAGLVIQTAPGQLIDHGLSLINDKLSYNTEAPIDSKNRPALYITDNCQQLIEAFKNYTGCSRDEVWKDPIDCVRYLLEAGANFVPSTNMSENSRTFSY